MFTKHSIGACVLLTSLLACNDAENVQNFEVEGETMLYADSSDNTVSEQLDSTFYYRISDQDYNSGYVNHLGDTVVPIGKYMNVSTDSFKNFAIVMTQEFDWIGIDKKENKLFDIFIFEQGPDYVEEGLFRIEKNDKIGYANEQGEVVIEPIYSCAKPFKDGFAEVALNCTTVQSDPEHWSWQSDDWFYIDRKGNRVEGVKQNF